MKRLLDRMFKFLEVNDPKQTNINRLLFILIVSWAAFSFIMNSVNQFIYYFITLPSFKTQQSMVMIWIPEIPDLPSPIANLMFWVAATIIGSLVTALVYKDKQQQDILKSISPLLAEVKTFLILNLKK